MGLFQLLHIVGMSTQKEPSLLCTLPRGDSFRRKETEAADFRFSILIFGELAPIPRCLSP